jgi:hypothetical protein
MTEAQKTLATKLRADGLSYEKIKTQAGIPLSALRKFFNPLLGNQPTQLLPPMTAPSSIPIHKLIRHEDRMRVQLTKPELYRDLAQAVRNTR